MKEKKELEKKREELAKMTYHNLENLLKNDEFKRDFIRTILLKSFNEEEAYNRLRKQVREALNKFLAYCIKENLNSEYVLNSYFSIEFKRIRYKFLNEKNYYRAITLEFSVNPNFYDIMVDRDKVYDDVLIDLGNIDKMERIIREEIIKFKNMIKKEIEQEIEGKDKLDKVLGIYTELLGIALEGGI